jgi:hypothetical protein
MDLANHSLAFPWVLKWCQRRDLNPRPKAYENFAQNAVSPLFYWGVLHAKKSVAQVVD